MLDTEHNVQESGPLTDGQELIILDDVTKAYTSGSHTFTALDHLSLTIKQGTFVAIVGASGSGKSTALNMITGIDRPTSGSIRINQTQLETLSENNLARWRGTNLGLVFQFQQLMPTLTIIENVMLAMEFVGTVPPAERPERAMHTLELVGVTDQANKFPTELSGGQQQRAAIARSLANDPPLIAADEPTGNLDSTSADVILDLFRSLAQDGKTVVMVTHEREIAHRVDRVITLSDGRLVQP